MIQVLHRAFDILDLLASDPDRPMRLAQIAERLELHAGTCANILKTMVRRGYVDQVTPRGRYVLGPAVGRLARSAPYRRDLVAAAEAPMTRLARRVHETVLIAALRDHCRVTLCEIHGDQVLQVRRDVVTSEDVYSTATGRVLLAHLGSRAFEAVVARHGLPAASWPEAGSKARLRAAVSKIRADEVVAALGLYLPRFRYRGRHRQDILAGLEATAEAIGRRLTRPEEPEHESH